MSEPKLRVRASGYGGSGYAIPTRPDAKGKPLKVPGVTTVINALEKPGIVQWAVDNTAAYAVANIQSLSERDDDWGYRSLRFYHSRKIEHDSPDLNVNNYHTGVLNDLADQGTLIHEAIEAFIKDDFGPTFARVEQEEAFETFLDWVEESGVKFLHSEATVFNPDEGYAGTGDIWAEMPTGKTFLIDGKTSRKIHDSHTLQSAALMNCPIMLVEDPEGAEYESKGVKTRWKEVEAPEVDGIAVLQVRPRTVDDYGVDIPAFTKLHVIPKYEVEPAYEQFLGALRVRKGQTALKDARKKAEANEYF